MLLLCYLCLPWLIMACDEVCILSECNTKKEMITEHAKQTVMYTMQGKGFRLLSAPVAIEDVCVDLSVQCYKNYVRNVLGCNTVLTLRTSEQRQVLLKNLVEVSNNVTNKKQIIAAQFALGFSSFRQKFSNIKVFDEFLSEEIADILSFLSTQEYL